MGSSWSDFSPVRDVWLEAFGSKPYVVHTLAIAGMFLGLFLSKMYTIWHSVFDTVNTWGKMQATRCSACCGGCGMANCQRRITLVLR